MKAEKDTGPDGMPTKVIKTTSRIVVSHLTNVINQNIIELNSFPEFAKVASVRLLYRKKRFKIKNYRPVSILNAFQKLMKLHNYLTPFVNGVLPDFVSAYRKGFGSNHVLTKLIEDWIIKYLPKVFDCIPLDLLIAKMSPYGFSMDTLVFMYYYLKKRKQNVKISNIESLWKILVSGVPQVSILGLILFNLFINDLFLFIKKVNLANFTHDKTIYPVSTDITSLPEILKSESE